MAERDLLALRGLSPGEVRRLIDRAKARVSSRALAGKSVGLFFEKASTRTRVSFEVAITQVGGHPVFLPAQEIQLGRGETVADTARVLSRYLDALVIRTFGQDRLVEWARYATIPVGAYPVDEVSASSDYPRFPLLREIVEVTGFEATTSLDDEW